MPATPQQFADQPTPVRRTAAQPRMPFSGVRSSWLTLAMKRFIRCHSPAEVVGNWLEPWSGSDDCAPFFVRHKTHSARYGTWFWLCCLLWITTPQNSPKNTLNLLNSQIKLSKVWKGINFRVLLPAVSECCPYFKFSQGPTNVPWTLQMRRMHFFLKKTSIFSITYKLVHQIQSKFNDESGIDPPLSWTDADLSTNEVSGLWEEEQQIDSSQIPAINAALVYWKTVCWKQYPPPQASGTPGLPAAPTAVKAPANGGCWGGRPSPPTPRHMSRCPEEKWGPCQKCTSGETATQDSQKQKRLPKDKKNGMVNNSAQCLIFHIPEVHILTP